MKKNKKNNNKVDKILKGVVTAGVAIGGASYMNDADMVYAAELNGDPTNYPDNPGIQELEKASESAYNSNVSILNQKAVSFPASIVAGVIGVSRMQFFEAEDAKRSDVDVKINI